MATYSRDHWTCRSCKGSNYKQYAKRRTCLDCVARKKIKYKENGQEKSSNLKKMYGIDIIKYNELLGIQNSKCAICKKEEWLQIRGKIMSLAVDHCHRTGAVRGLLCHACNQGLGKFNDNPELLRESAAYIEIYL